MSLKKISAREFERLISRLHDLIEEHGTIIKWNDHIDDPNTKGNKRQIDITIEKGGKKTHIECRLHKAKQGSPWIEQLYGRKVNLGVDTLIGVSSSGFSKPAINTAKKLGIILKDLRSIDIDEAINWGKPLTIRAKFIRLTDTKLRIFSRPPKPPKFKPLTPIGAQKAFKKLETHQNLASRLINQFAYTQYEIFKENDLPIGSFLRTATHKLWIKDPVPLATGVAAYLIELTSTPQLIEMEMNTDYAALYSDSYHEKEQQKVIHKQLSMKNWEINSSKSKSNAQIDLSTIIIPSDLVLMQVGIVNTEGNGSRVKTLSVIGLDKYHSTSGFT